MNEKTPIIVILSSNDVTINNVETLNKLTQELGRNLENYPEAVESISYGGRESLPEGTKVAELIFAQQAILSLIPIVTPWVLDKINAALKALLASRNPVNARVLVGNREIHLTPETTPSELANIKHRIKAANQLADSKRCALVIGNSHYDHQFLADLDSPIADAEQLAEVLADPNIGAFTQVEKLINQSSSVIKQSIEQFFSNRQRDDFLVLYISGHGIRNKAGQLFLAAKNTAQEFLRSTGISAGFIKEIMDESNSQRQLLILDCCYGGAIVEGTKSTQVVGQPVDSILAFQNSGFGRVIITASESMQYAFDGQHVDGKAGNSLFTRHLIEGLRTGRADTDNDGLVTIDELYQYAYQNVVPKQTPNISSKLKEGRIFIASNPDPTVRPSPLPVQIERAMKSEDRLYRQGAVSELGQLLRSNDASVILSAELALRQMTQDDSKKVGELAQETLDQFLGKRVTFPQQKGAQVKILSQDIKVTEEDIIPKRERGTLAFEGEESVIIPSVIEDEEVPARRKDRGLAMVLAIFLGDFGIHRFYLGQFGKGLVYLLLCWTFIPWFVALIDAFRWAVMGNEEFHQRYG